MIHEEEADLGLDHARSRQVPECRYFVVPGELLVVVVATVLLECAD